MPNGADENFRRLVITVAAYHARLSGGCSTTTDILPTDILTISRADI